MTMNEYVEYRMGDKGTETASQWVEIATHAGKSRRQVMKTLRKQDEEKGLGHVQRKVVKV